MATYTLTAIDRINGSRVRQARFKPQPGLTMKDLEKISKDETAKLRKRNPGMNKDDIYVCLEYRSEQK